MSRRIDRAHPELSGVTRLYPAIMKYWRQQRGLSQLDLALAAEISSRHVSFLETGRAQPSRDMVLRLGAALNLTLRDQNALLEAAGFPPAFGEPTEQELAPEIEQVLQRMLAQHEPFPLVVVNRGYDVLQANRGALRLLKRFIAEPDALGMPLNVLRLLFDSRLGRRFVLDWEHVAHLLLTRVHREVLSRPNDAVLATFLDELCAYPEVPRSWRQPDFSARSEPALILRLRRDELEVSFLTTITTFNAPQNVTLEEMRIDSYFPLDPQTERVCTSLAEQEP
jgi:transcriptional regulator with XRE-family HTH domain